MSTRHVGGYPASATPASELKPPPPSMVSRQSSDPWRMVEWNSLPDACLFAACASSPDDIDQRGPVHLRDGSMHKACSEHWEPIMRVLGEQASWESTDAMRGGHE